MRHRVAKVDAGRATVGTWPPVGETHACLVAGVARQALIMWVQFWASGAVSHEVVSGVDVILHPASLGPGLVVDRVRPIVRSEAFVKFAVADVGVSGGATRLVNIVRFMARVRPDSASSISMWPMPAGTDAGGTPHGRSSPGGLPLHRHGCLCGVMSRRFGWPIPHLAYGAWFLHGFVVPRWPGRPAHASTFSPGSSWTIPSRNARLGSRRSYSSYSTQACHRPVSARPRPIVSWAC